MSVFALRKQAWNDFGCEAQLLQIVDGGDKAPLPRGGADVTGQAEVKTSLGMRVVGRSRNA